MYQALYRKWRPTVFEDVLGQSHITDTLKNQIENHKLSHAYLFSGSRGTGKTSTAKILSRAVNCENPNNGNPCNECHACKTALNGSAVDIIEIDAASNNRVDDVRIIRDEVVYTPADLKYKVYIIDEAHMLTNQAFNALLKTLEEPPAHVIFIFATTEPHKFPATILSRCQRFDFKRITPYDTEKRIRQIIGQDGYTISEEAVGLLARIADGSMRDALSILDQCLSAGVTAIEFGDIARITGASDPNFIYGFAQSLIDGDLSACFSAVKAAYENGRDMERILEDLVEHFRGVLITKTLESEDAALEVLMTTKTAYRIYAAQAQEMSTERILRYLDCLSEAGASQKYLQNPRLCVEMAVTAMVKRPDLTDAKGLAERLLELENKLNRLSYQLQSGVVPKESVVTKSLPKQEIPIAETMKENMVLEETVAPVPEVTANDMVPEVPEAFEVLEVKEEELVEFVPDYPVESYAGIQEEASEIPVSSEPKVLSRTSVSDGALAAQWENIVETAASKADFGFRRIMGSSQLSEGENGVEVLISSEPFLNIAKMNQYDKAIQYAIREVTGKDCVVKLRSGSKAPKEGDSFDRLLQKLDRYQDKITFK